MSLVENGLKLHAQVRDIFIETQSGQIRKVTIPLSLVAFAAWVFDPRSDPSPGGFDKGICSIADAKSLSYEEATLEFLHICMGRDVLWNGYEEAMRDDAIWKPAEDAFVEDQRQKLMAWRAANPN